MEKHGNQINLNEYSKKSQFYDGGQIQIFDKWAHIKNDQTKEDEVVEGVILY